MHEDRNPRDDSVGEPSAPDREDARSQSVVLALLLAEQPQQFTEAELACELLGENPDFSERDGFERAIDDLIRAGLLQRQGEFILLTRTARHFDSLELE